jgi:mannose-1-phosphate guanylyltransferase
MDIGQPKDYLTGVSLYLGYMLEQQKRQQAAATVEVTANGASSPAVLYDALTAEQRAAAPRTVIVPPVLIAPDASIGDGCVIGPAVTVASHCVVSDGVRLRNSAVLEDAKIGAHSRVANSIIGWQSSVGAWARLDGVTVLGQDVHVAAETYVNGARVLPHKSVQENIPDGRIVL